METKQRQPRYKKSGEIFKQDRHYMAQGWPAVRGPVVPAYQPAPGPVAASLAAPNPMKRKGRC